MPIPALVAVLLASSLIGLAALGASGPSREIVRFTFQPPLYVDAAKVRTRTGSTPQTVIPSIQEILFPDGWRIEHLASREEILAQTMTMRHKLLPFMQPALSRQLPVFAYRVISPSGNTLASAVITFDGCYRIVHVQGPDRREPLPTARRRTEDLAIALNGGTLVVG